MTIRILHGDCRDQLKKLPDASVDSVVTDPPYELGFMGKKWDASGIAYDPAVWCECLRVLKPGGHLLAFGGSRTYHRMACAIEDAGFEIRDQIMWVYGSGFPKSLDVSRAIDRSAGVVRDRVSNGRTAPLRGVYAQDEWTRQNCNTRADPLPITDTAKDWSGWGTALKPAHEPICMARKPLQGTVAANVLKWGTGGLNIDGCRIEIAESDNSGSWGNGRSDGSCWSPGRTNGGNEPERQKNAAGRWPANLIHDGSDEVVALFPNESGANGTKNSAGARHGFVDERNSVRSDNWGDPRDELGSASRFFYCPKADRADRNDGCEGMGARQTTGDFPALVCNVCGCRRVLNYKTTCGHDDARREQGAARRNHHPTVKPTDLMRYLCRLVTPKGGTVLDPFMGSGSTLKAAELEGFRAIGIELDAQYVEIAKRRIASDMPLFQTA